MKKESKLIRTYRAVLRGVTNGEFIHQLGLGAVYRSRVSDLRKMMYLQYGKSQDWIPKRLVKRTSEMTVYAWKLVVPQDVVNPRDPLSLLPPDGENQLTSQAVPLSNGQNTLDF